jgi:hypothetical protein
VANCRATTDRVAGHGSRREKGHSMNTQRSQTPRISQFTRRLVRFVLDGGRTVEGNIHVSERQSLCVFLSTRRYLTSLTEVRWVGPEGKVVPHLAVRTDRITYATSLDDDLPISTNSQPTIEPRWAEFTLDDGSIMDVGLHIAEEQRMTDYFDSAPVFIPAVQAMVVGQERLLGPISVNMLRVIAIREIEPRMPTA